MKMAYEKPMMDVEVFVANEYVAACGDSGKTYLFECNAGDGVSGDVWLETNNQPGLQRGGFFGDTKLTSVLRKYHACNIKHEASSMDQFQNGYYVPSGESTATDVIVWQGSDGDNIHCTTKLDINSWETAKS